MPGWFWTALSSSGETLVMTSVPPARSSLMRAVPSGIGRKTTCFMRGSPLQCGPAASTTNLSFGVQETNLYGPVPIGFLTNSAASAAAFGGSIST